MPPEGLNEVDARDQLARVLASAGFARNERMSRFLTFVVEESLAGRGDNLKESVIALEVFARRPDYDPRIDSIVRTEAARLRTRLAEYYAGAGKLDDVLITVPKGGYHPVFTTREHAEEPAPNRRLWQRLWVALACGAAAAVGLSAWLAVGAARPIRIAVLPLENLSTEPSSAYFADGLTDEIIRNLSVIDGLAVRSRTSSFAFKARPRDLRAAGKQLEADYLLDGSILRDGDRL